MPRINKNIWLACIFACLLTILSSCNYNEKIDVVFFERTNYQVYLYSDGNDENLENNYLSAILDLRITYPNVVNQMHVEEATAIGLRQKDIGEYPTLIILKDGVTIEKLSGENHKKKILNRLEETLVSEEKTTYISSNN